MLLYTIQRNTLYLWPLKSLQWWISHGEIKATSGVCYSAAVHISWPLTGFHSRGEWVDSVPTNHSVVWGSMHPCYCVGWQQLE